MRRIKEVKIKSLYKGFAAIRDKIIADAERENADLKIIVGSKQMILPMESFAKYNYHINVKDKFTDATHKLLYFTWEETNKHQSNLF